MILEELRKSVVCVLWLMSWRWTSPLMSELSKLQSLTARNIKRLPCRSERKRFSLQGGVTRFALCYPTNQTIVKGMLISEVIRAFKYHDEEFMNGAAFHARHYCKVSGEIFLQTKRSKWMVKCSNIAHAWLY